MNISLIKAFLSALLFAAACEANAAPKVSDQIAFIKEKYQQTHERKDLVQEGTSLMITGEGEGVDVFYDDALRVQRIVVDDTGEYYRGHHEFLYHQEKPIFIFVRIKRYPGLFKVEGAYVESELRVYFDAKQNPIKILKRERGERGLSKNKEIIVSSDALAEIKEELLYEREVFAKVNAGIMRDAKVRRALDQKYEGSFAPKSDGEVWVQKRNCAMLYDEAKRKKRLACKFGKASKSGRVTMNSSSLDVIYENNKAAAIYLSERRADKSQKQWRVYVTNDIWAIAFGNKNAIRPASLTGEHAKKADAMVDQVIKLEGLFFDANAR